MTGVELLYYIVPVVLTIAANRFGIKLPGQPDFKFPPPAPVPAVEPAAADKPAVEFLGWLLKVNSGQVKLDPLDKEALKSIKSALAEAEAK